MVGGSWPGRSRAAALARGPAGGRRVPRGELEGEALVFNRA